MTAAASRPWRRRRRSVVSLLAGAALLVAGPASAQVAASVSAFSDDVFRGVSLSGGRPIAGVDLAYDHPTGLYLGASAVSVLTAHSGMQWLTAQEYAGYARRIAPDLTADIGLTHADYTEYYAGHAAAAYSEAYVGLATRHFASRLYYSPRYFGHGRQTLYAEVEGTMRPRPQWRLSAHLGLLAYVSGSGPAGVSDTAFDWRLGLAREFGGLAVQLALTGRGDDGGYSARRETVILGLTHAF